MVMAYGISEDVCLACGGIGVVLLRTKHHGFCAIYAVDAVDGFVETTQTGVFLRGDVEEVVLRQ